MSTLTTSLLSTMVTVGLVASLVACSSNSSVSEQTILPEQAWSCPKNPGRAPRGELVASRIMAAQTTRNEPGLFEGPVWIDDALYFSDFVFSAGFPSRIMRLGADGRVSVAIDHSGSNGLAIDHHGNILAATHDRKAISRYQLPAGTRQIVVDQFEGNPFNSPNDLTLSKNGILYFTDPGFQRNAAPGGQPLTRIYQVKDGVVTVVDETLSNPNGIGLSPEQTTLYVAAAGALRTYPISSSGQVGRGTELVKLTGPDGLAIDCLGNIYATEHSQQQIRVFSPRGVELAVIKVDANVTNAAFGGADRKTLFITGAGAVWTLDLDVVGFPY